jgi:hypothetical protein
MSGECEKCNEHTLDCNCKKCENELELYSPDWPWEKQYWVCPNCGWNSESNTQNPYGTKMLADLLHKTFWSTKK